MCSNNHIPLTRKTNQKCRFASPAKTVIIYILNANISARKVRTSPSLECITIYELFYNLHAVYTSCCSLFGQINAKNNISYTRIPQMHKQYILRCLFYQKCLNWVFKKYFHYIDPFKKNSTGKIKLQKYLSKYILEDDFEEDWELGIQVAACLIQYMNTEQTKTMEK